MGCLLALIIYDPRVTIRLAMPGPVRDTINAVGVVAGLVAGRGLDDGGAPPTSTWWLAGWLLVALVSAVVVLASIVPEGPVPWLLTSPPLRWLGRIAIALYLVHWPVFVWIDRAHTGLTRQHAHRRPPGGRVRRGGGPAAGLRAGCATASAVRPAPGPRPGRGRAWPAAAWSVWWPALLAATAERPGGGLDAGRRAGPTSTTDHDHPGPAAGTHGGLLRRRPGLDAGGERQVVGGAHRQDQGRGRGRLAHLRHRPRRAGPGRRPARPCRSRPSAAPGTPSGPRPPPPPSPTSPWWSPASASWPTTASRPTPPSPDRATRATTTSCCC